jgi:hypothetical protein
LRHQKACIQKKSKGKDKLYFFHCRVLNRTVLKKELSIKK